MTKEQVERFLAQLRTMSAYLPEGAIKQMEVSRTLYAGLARFVNDRAWNIGVDEYFSP